MLKNFSSGRLNHAIAQAVRSLGDYGIRDEVQIGLINFLCSQSATLSY
jgi:hypothetical protein